MWCKKQFMLNIMVSVMWHNGVTMLSELMAQESIPVEVYAQQRGTIKLALIVVMTPGNGNGETVQALNDLARYVQKDLSFTKQFSVDIIPVTVVPTKQELQELHKKGFELAVFLQYPLSESAKLEKKDQSIEWRLYDLAQCSMLKGKRYAKKGSFIRGWAHAIADALWPELAQMPGFFSTKIAYCKDVKDGQARAVKHICIADYDGTHEQVLIDTHTLNVAPRWNVDTEYPVLFYSEHTSSNVRLVMVTMDKKRRIVVNFDGLTMLPSFSPDGQRVVFCASRGDGACDLYCFERGNLKRLTRNQGNNLAPSFTENNDCFFFCSDRDGLPQIYTYHFSTGATERITSSGYCVSPSYSPVTKSLAYAKMVRGTMQLFVYNTVTKEHTQLTSDTGNKDECSWSACGNYLLFCVQQGMKSRIAMMQVLSKETRFLTTANEVCSYPTWSGIYTQLPVVT